MGALAVDEAVRRARTYPHGVVSYVDADGYPMSVAASHADGPEGELVLGPLSPRVLPKNGTEVGILFSHIRPQPGIGYDERRYVDLWGPAQVKGGLLRVTPTTATGWDEAETPF